jgi:hypothetical protein
MIYEFVETRYRELIEIAKKAGAPLVEWKTACAEDGECTGLYGSCSRIECDQNGMTIYDEGGHDVDDARHIVTFDPRFTMSWLSAQFEILRLHSPCADEPECHVCGPRGGSGACLTVMLLARPFAAHQDFRPEWATRP